MVVGRSEEETVIVVIGGTGAGSTRVEVLAGTLVEELAGTLVVVVAVNRGEVAGRLTGTGNITGPEPTDLVCSLALLTPP